MDPSKTSNTLSIHINFECIQTDEEEDEVKSADSICVEAGTQCVGHLIESKLKQLLTFMPIIYVKAIQVRPQHSGLPSGTLSNANSILRIDSKR